MGECTLYPLIRFSPHFMDGECMGIVRNLISPQQEENKRRSQALHLINSAANSGWLMDEKALSPDQYTRLEHMGSRPGILIEKKPGAFLERIEPAQLSIGHIQLAQMAGKDIKEISGVNQERLGYESKSGTSGRALALQQRQGAQVTAPIMERWDYTLRLVGDLVVCLVAQADIYTDEEIKSIVGRDERLSAEIEEEAQKQVMSSGLPEPGEQPPPPGPELAQLAPDDQQAVVSAFQQAQADWQRKAVLWQQAIAKAGDLILMKQIRDARTGRYGVKVSESAASPTTRLAHFQELMEVAKLFPGAIDPAAIIKASDIANKDEILRGLQAAAQAPAPAGGRMPSPANMGL
jgi:hypothetical protein